jgi:NADH-quinone oxidoreductase E subunit
MSITPLGGRPMAAGKPFAFTAENRALADKIIAKYPAGRQQSAVMPLLDLAQRQNDGWLSREALAHVAEVLDMALIRVYEVATFYTMYNLTPVGRHLVLVCTTTPCWLRGSDEVVAACRTALGVDLGGTTADGQFTLREVECLGACVNAPMAQIGDDYYEDLDAKSMTALIETLKRGETPKPGPQTARQTSAPLGGATTLKDLPAKQGS